MTAELVSDVSHGELALGTDGYFVYTSEVGYSGSDSFTYQAHDSQGDSSYVTTVSLNVTKPFGNRSNTDDLPSAGNQSYGVFNASLQTGDVQTGVAVGDGQELVYQSLSGSDPIIAVESVYQGSYSLYMAEVEARLTLGGVAKDPVYYSASTLAGAATNRFALQVDASTLGTGHYDWEMDVVLHLSDGNTATNVFTGSANVVKRDDSEFGPGWTLASLDRLHEQTGGVLLVQGDGTAFWFVDNQDDTFTSPAGPLATTSLVRNVDDSFTLTDKFGNAEQFDADGLLTARVDRNGNSTDYAYTDADGDQVSDEISTVTDPFGRETTFNYSSGFVSSVEDNAGRVTTIGRDGSHRITSITGEDPDDTGPLAAAVTEYAYGTNGLLSSISDPLDNETTFAYDFAGRLSGATNPDSSAPEFAAIQVQGVIDTASGDGTQQNLATLPSNYFPEALWTNELGHESSFKIDRFGYVTKSTNAQSQVTLYERDADGRVTKRTDPDPDGTGGLSAPVTEYDYDSNGNLLSITFPDETTQSWTYHSTLNVPLTFTDQLGNETDYTYDSYGNRLTVTDALGNETDYEYNTNGQVTSITGEDPDGAGPLGQPETTYGYDTSGRLTTITNPDTTTRTFTYDSADNLLTETDELSRVTTYDYDALGRLISKTLPDPDGAGSQVAPEFAWEYNAGGQLVTETDPAGNDTTYAYSSRGWLTSITYPDPDGAGSQTSPVVSYGYDAAGQRVTDTDPLGNVTTTAYDSLGRVTSLTLPDPDGAGSQTSPVTHYYYNNVGWLTSILDPLGNTTAYDHDIMGRVVETTDELNGAVTNVYDDAGNLTSVTDELSRQTTYAYNDVNQLTTTTLPDPDGAGSQTSPVYTYTYYADGRLKTTTDPLSNVTTNTYDVMGRLVLVTDALDNETAYSYDDAGQLVSVSDALDRVTEYDYDALGRRISLTDPLQNVTSYEFDVLSRLVLVTDALNNETASSYDNLGRLVLVTDALDGDTAYTYDAAGRMLTLTDASGNVTTYSYDNLGRLLTETNDLTDVRTFVYDKVGNVTKITDRDGRVKEFTYDDLYRKTQEVWKIDTTTVETIGYTWDAAGQLTAISDGNSAYAYSYDNLGRMLTVDNDGTAGSPAVVLANEYNAAGLRTRLAAEIDGTGDFENVYSYDDLLRLTRIEQDGQTGGASVSEKRVDLAYNAAGQFATITRYEDLAGTELVATTTYGYDGAGRLTSLDHDKDTTSLAAYDWTYDSAGRITEFVSVDGTTDYTYDGTGQLSAADHTYQNDESYSYDATGNRTNTGYTTGDNNQLLDDGTYDYEYDDEGNRTKKTHGTTGDYVEYDWDHKNRLTTVSFRTTTGTLTKQVQYTYDVYDRLIRKQVDDDGDSTIDRTQVFVYDGSEVVLVLDEAGSFTNRYIHGPAVDQVFMEESIGEILWGLADNQGTIRDIANYDPIHDESSVLNHREFDSFGNITAESNGSIEFRYAYTGRYFDEDTGLQYNRRRWYAPEIGRWISEDPIGFAAGDANISRYVGNSPTNFTDPSGQLEQPDLSNPKYVAYLAWLAENPVGGSSPGFWDDPLSWVWGGGGQAAHISDASQDPVANWGGGVINSVVASAGGNDALAHAGGWELTGYTTVAAIPVGFGLAFGGEFVIGAFAGGAEVAGAGGLGGGIAAEEAGVFEDAGSAELSEILATHEQIVTMGSEATSAELEVLATQEQIVVAEDAGALPVLNYDPGELLRLEQQANFLHKLIMQDPWGTQPEGWAETIKQYNRLLEIMKQYYESGTIPPI
jgi:RHS repeat-associated protein